MPISAARPADWADEPGHIQNSVGNPMFNRIELTWTEPTQWRREERAPDFDKAEPFLYALIRDHGNAADRDRIEYIGLTTNPKARFGNHTRARKIVDKPGTVHFSYAPIDWIRGRNRVKRIKYALEQIEHLLIWAVSDNLWNDKKQFTLPGMGVNGGSAWHILNKGYRFRGRMPREIIYPWMLIVPGRDRTAR